MRTAVLANAAILAGVAAAQLRLPLFRPPASPSVLGRREASADLTGDSLRYFVNVTVGTPPQELSLSLSLDSHVSWVPDAESCDDGCTGGSYNLSASSSYHDSDGNFSIRFSDGTAAHGPEFKDTIRVGGTEVKSFPIGLAREGVLTQGELAFSPTIETENSFVKRLVKDGLTKSASYSFCMGDQDGTSGSVLFGAVDASAFDGPLQRISTYPAESAYVGFPVDFSILNYTDSSGGDPKAVAPQNDLPLILIRPADMLTNLPGVVAKKIWKLAGASYEKSSSLATIPCAGTNGSASELILGLGARGNAAARVSFDDLIIPHDIVSLGSGNETCVFAIKSDSGAGQVTDDDDGPWSLGGIVLQNTYIAFDLVNEAVAFAPVRPDSGSRARASDIVPFPSYGAEVPHSEAADPVCSPSPCELDSTDDGDRPTSAFVVIIALAIGVLLVLGSLLWLCWYRGYCCFKSRRCVGEEAAVSAAQSGPISEKVIYAGAAPPALPPRPVAPGSNCLPSGQLPLGCAWIPAPVMYSPLRGSLAPPPTAARSAPSATQPAESLENSTEATRADSPSVCGSASPPASPSDGPPPRSVSPTDEGTVPPLGVGSPGSKDIGNTVPKETDIPGTL